MKMVLSVKFFRKNITVKKMSAKQILSSIYENTKKVLKDMAGVNTKLMKIQPVDKAPSEDYSILMGISGSWSCVIVVGFDLETGLALASRLSGKTYEGDFDEESESALCELANIIIGNAMNALDGLGFEGNLTPPTFSQGKGVSFFTPGTQKANLLFLDIGIGVLKIFVSSKKQ